MADKKIDSKTRIKEYIQKNFPKWERVDYSNFCDENIEFDKNLSELYKIDNEEIVLISYTNISITGTERTKPQLRVFLDEYKKPFYFAKKHQLRYYLFSIFTKEDDMARGLDNFNPKEYVISIETNLDTEGARRDLRSIYDYANDNLKGRRFLKCTRSNYKADINQASFIYIGSEQNPDKEVFENFVNIFDSRPYLNSTNDCNIITGPHAGLLYMGGQNLSFLTALRTKPFLLLAGISGTGKSRIVRELARASWKSDDPEYKAHKPRNFEMVQVKPNWHDSSELIGYVSRIGEKPEFIAGEFLKFVAKAWSEPNVPYFLCLDEMNLAPVEQYFAEYLSVIESRKLEDGKIVTDPLLRKEAQEWYHTLVSTLTDDEDLHEQFLSKGITIPQNLFVIGTVNMDETTFSFSRKVLDRAMTIEMNDVDLTGGLETDAENEFGYIGPSEDGIASPLIPQVVEGKDVYSANKNLCDEVIKFLTSVNQVLDKTPFKIAYRTRNEFLVYAVCRGEENLSNALDEMTSMKILSRIEGDAEKTERVLNDLDVLLRKTFDGMEKSISLAKIDEMTEKLNRTQYTSFWS